MRLLCYQQKLNIICWSWSQLPIPIQLMHRGAFCQFPFRWISYYGSNKFIKKLAKRTSVQCNIWEITEFLLCCTYLTKLQLWGFCLSSWRHFIHMHRGFIKFFNKRQERSTNLYAKTQQYDECHQRQEGFLTRFPQQF